MNKIIASSNYLLTRIRIIEQTNYDSWQVFGSKDGLKIGDFKFGCYCQNDFNVTLYRRSLTRLIKILRQVEDQPVTLQFEDDGVFNITIRELSL